MIRRDEARKEALKTTIHELEEEINFLRKQKIYQPLMKEWEVLKDIPPVAFLQEDIQKVQGFYSEYEEYQRQIRHLQVDLKNRSGLKEASEEDYLWYKNHLPQVEEGKNLLTNLQTQKEQAVILEEKLRGKNEQLAFFKTTYGFEESNPPQKLTPEKQEVVKNSFERLEEEKAKLEQVRLKPVEKENQFLFYGSMGLGVILIIASFLVPGFGKLLLLFLGIACLLAGGLTLLKQKKQAPKENEETISRRIEGWEEEISQLEKQLHLGKLSLKDVIQPDSPVVAYEENLVQKRSLEKEYQKLQEEKSHILNQIGDVIPFLKDQEEPTQLFFAYLDEMEKIQFAIEKNDVKKVEEELLLTQQKVTSLEDQAHPFLNRLSLTYLYEVPQRIEKLKQLAQKNKRKDEIYPQIKEFLQEGVLILKDEDELLTEKEQAQKDLMTVTEREQTNRAQADFLVENGTLEVLLQEQANLETELENLTQDYMKHRLMGNFINDLSRELSEQSLPNLLQTVGEIFRYLTLNRYQRVFFYQENLQVQDQAGVLWSLKDLSTGTKDQLLFAFRFAFISLQDQNNACPVIIDDGWLRYDQSRKQQFLKLLSQSIDNQVLLLSSDEKMKELVKQNHQEILHLSHLN